MAWFTPQEAGGLGAVVMVLVSLPYLLLKNSPYPKLTWKSLVRALLEAVKVASMILVLIFGARYFSYFLTTSDIAESISNAVVESGLNRYIVMILVADPIPHPGLPHGHLVGDDHHAAHLLPSAGRAARVSTRCSWA